MFLVGKYSRGVKECFLLVHRNEQQKKVDNLENIEFYDVDGSTEMWMIVT